MISNFPIVNVPGPGFGAVMTNILQENPLNNNTNSHFDPDLDRTKQLQSGTAGTKDLMSNMKSRH
jgi:hypothetical protein